ncbi:alpha/beta fold hydrolase [Phaeobacter sp. C3_T13_0]|uniref:alpha/beta fold hydrolase n=1 Tax=Phaeobacter cretensis TaxID=3342641 RepID=UPI0039BCAEAC
MTDLLLVHGSCHGAWCWRDLLPALADQGLSAGTIDLPGNARSDSGQSRDMASITLSETATAIREATDSNTVLLGHSWAGYPISAAADMATPLRGLIYLCAYVPQGGVSMIEMRKRSPRQTLAGKTVKAADGHSYCFDLTTATDLLYHDCPASTAAYALPRLSPQAIRPQDTPLQLGAQWQATPKAYIRCTGDRVIPPEYQTQMVTDWPPHKVTDLDTSHSPFFAAPQRLATMIATLVKDL